MEQAGRPPPVKTGINKNNICRFTLSPSLMRAFRYFLIKRGRRPAMLQKMIDMRKRLRGPPTSGTISIVVTDIEGFSGEAVRMRMMTPACCRPMPTF